MGRGACTQEQMSSVQTRLVSTTLKGSEFGTSKEGTEHASGNGHARTKHDPSLLIGHDDAIAATATSLA